MWKSTGDSWRLELEVELGMWGWSMVTRRVADFTSRVTPNLKLTYYVAISLDASPEIEMEMGLMLHPREY